MGYEIVEYRPEFKSQILELQTHLWGSDAATNASYFEWKYRCNPYVEKPLIQLALCAGKVVGMRGAYGAKWQIGPAAETFHAPCAGDFVIAPEHRCRGVFASILEAAARDLACRGYRYVFNLSAGAVTRIGSLALGWRSVGYLNTLRRGRWSRMFHGDLQNYAAKLAFLASLGRRDPFCVLDDAAGRDRSKIGAFVSVARSARPEAMAQLVERLGADGRLRHVKDKAYFAWRFENPRAVYRFLFWIDRRMEGYLVLQAKRYKERTKVNIVDWEAAAPTIRADLLQAAVAWGRFAELNIWTATLSGETIEVLARAGFEPLKPPASIADYQPAILVRDLGDPAAADRTIGGRRLMDLASWDVRMIDSDSY